MKFKDRLDWLMWRRKGLGASDSYIIMDLVDWSTPLKLYYDKISTENIVEEENYQMKLGNDAEPKIRALLELKLGESFKEAAVESGEIPYFRASLDGYSKDKKKAAEIKLLNDKDWLLAKEKGIVPEKYIVQMQHQMMVSEATVNYFTAYRFKEYKMGGSVSLEHLAVVEVPEDHVKQGEILRAGQNFWENHVLKRKPPEPGEKDWHQIEDSEHLIPKLKEANKKLELYKKLVDSIKKKMVDEAKASGARLVTYGDCKVTKVDVSGSINYKIIPEILEMKEEELEKYRGSSTTQWRVTVPKQKSINKGEK